MFVFLVCFPRPHQLGMFSSGVGEKLFRLLNDRSRRLNSSNLKQTSSNFVEYTRTPASLGHFEKWAHLLLMKSKN